MSGYMRRVSTIQRLLSSPFGDQARLLAGTVFLISISIGFVIGSFSQIRRQLLWMCNTISPAIPGNPTPGQVVSAVDVADHLIPGERTCLIRSLTAEALLRLYGFAPEHRIGVTRETDDKMKAHSWLELQDDVLIGDVEDLDQYKPLPALELGDKL